MSKPHLAFAALLSLAFLTTSAPAEAQSHSAALRQRLGLLERLDAARRDALALIRDEARYTKGNAESQREVNRLTEAVEEVYRPTEALLDRDLQRIVRRRATLEALTSAPTERLSAWERALLRRLGDLEVLRENEALPRTAPRDARPSAFQLEQLRLTNEHRILFGERPLAWDDRLAAAATGHSSEMVSQRYFDHYSPVAGRRTPSERASLSGFAGFAVGENIAQGYRSPAAVHRGWLTSAGHHRNILDPEWEAMGVGLEGDTWTQVFGRISETFASK